MKRSMPQGVFERYVEAYSKRTKAIAFRASNNFNNYT